MSNEGELLSNLPPPRDGKLPFLGIEEIHKGVIENLGKKNAAAFSRLMVFEQVPKDPETIKALREYLASREDYVSLMTAHKLEIIERGQPV